MRVASFASCPKNLGLYAVVPDAQWVAKVLQAGADTVQLRAKQDDRDQLKKEIVAAVNAAQVHSQKTSHTVRLFINDHWQMAIDAGAYGVHLGQEDLESADLAAIRDAGLRLGVSTHGVAQMQQAHLIRPSYMAIGAIFPTTTKVMTSAPQGLEKLKELAYLMSDYPLVAIGGINVDNARAVLACGVGSIAVVHALTDAPDVEVAIAQLKSCFETQAVLLLH